MDYNSQILLRRKNFIVLPDISAVRAGLVKQEVLAAFNLNLQQLGYTLSADAAKKILVSSSHRTLPVMTKTLELLKVARGSGTGLARPFYPNFPEQVAEATDAELYLNAFFHYFSVFVADITGNEDFIWFPKYRKIPRNPLSESDEKVKLTILKVVSEKYADRTRREILKQLVTSNTSISAQDKTDIIEIVKAGVTLGLDVEILNKENLAVYTAILLKEKQDINLDWFRTGTDILRLATALSDGDVSLKENTKFISFPRRVRRILLDLLSSDRNIQESFARDRERFVRLSERLHPGELKGTEYRRLKNAFKVLHSGLRLETFNSEVERLLKNGDAQEAADLLESRPGEFARRLNQLLLLATPSIQRRIVSRFALVADKVSTPVLLQLMTYFENRNIRNLRIIMPKGNVAKIQVIETKLPPLDVKVTAHITGIATNTLIERFEKLPEMGKVYVDSELRNYLIPFSQRSASAGLRTIVRGSHVPFGQGDTLRFFIHWKNTETPTSVWSNRRVDLDLSASMFDNDWRDKGQVWYGNLRRGYQTYQSQPQYTALHSGDITDAPKGAAEFIDIDIPSMLAHGARYIVMTVNMYSGPEYINQVPECFAGWMLRNEPQSGEVFEPKTVIDKLDITSESRMVVPMIIDLKERRVIWVDSEVSGVSRWGSNVSNQYSKIVLVGKAFTQIKKTTIYDLLMLHVAGRGKLAKTEKDADTVFSTKKGFQFELARISSEFMVNSVDN